MLSESKEFFIDLVSNASMDIYPENTLSKFRNKLPQPVRLDGNWVVGIQEAFYPIKFAPITRKISFILSYFLFEKSNIISGKTETVEFSDDDPIDTIFHKINEKLEKLYLEDEMLVPEDVGYKADRFPEAPKLIHLRHKTVVLCGHSTIGTTVPIFMQNDFLNALGFIGNEYKKQFKQIQKNERKELVSSYPPFIGTKPHLLFIYTDIIHDHFVGDCSARVLRVLPLRPGVYSDVGHIAFTKPYYFPVRLDNLESISIMLADENGNEIKFTDGRVYLSLHFMKKELV